MVQAKYRRDAMWGLDLFDPQVFLGGQSNSFAPGLAGYVARMRQPIADTLRKRLRLSAYRLRAQDLARYLERIAAFGAASLYGNSTALYLLAQQAELLGLRCELSILTGEPALAPLRQTVERAFNAPAVVEYGATECSVIATQWTDGTLRVREDLTLLETSPSPDGRFDIAITVLNNPAFPLIRYAIEDVTSAPVESPAIGFAIVKDVEGRRNDLLVSRIGRFVHSMAVKHVFENCPGVRRFRAHQNPSGALFILVEPASPHARLDTSQTERQLRDLLEGYPITLQMVASIPVSGVSGLSIPRALQGAVHIADLRIGETERGDGVNTTAGKIRIERLSIEHVAGGYEGEVVIGGAGTQIGWVRSINLYKPSLANRGKGQSKSPV